LDDLLSEPNLPKLSFTYGSDDGCQVWLNWRIGFASNERTGPLDPEAFTIKPLLLKLVGTNLSQSRAGRWRLEIRRQVQLQPILIFFSKLSFGDGETKNVTPAECHANYCP